LIPFDSAVLGARNTSILTFKCYDVSCKL